MFKKILGKLLGGIDVVSFRDGLKLTGLPIVCLNQGDKVFNFILDTGSDVSVIAEHVLPEIKYQKLDTAGTLYGLEGNRVNVEVCLINLEYNTTNFTNDFLIRDLKSAFDHMKKDHGVTVHGLLGSRFFNKYKYIIDFNNLIAYSKL